jgi:hypothetical protein
MSLSIPEYDAGTPQNYATVMFLKKSQRVKSHKSNINPPGRFFPLPVNYRIILRDKNGLKHKTE